MSLPIVSRIVIYGKRWLSGYAKKEGVSGSLNKNQVRQMRVMISKPKVIVKQ